MLIVGERYRSRLEKSLSRFGQSVLWLPDNPDLDPRLAGHADLSVCRINHKTLYAAESICRYIVKYFTIEANLGTASYIIIPAGGQAPVYPADAGLCVCYTGKYTFFNPKTVHKELVSRLSGVKIPVTQGYTRCSICVVTQDSIITSDDVIASRASAYGLDVLHITQGHIKLDGFSYGFIGGSAFRLSNDTIAFTGTLDRHPDKDAILSFLYNHNVTPFFLTNDGIFDIGGALWLKRLP